MEFNEDLVAIHAYLCADGYVIRNPETQKQKYYKIGLRNTNFILLQDFQERFFRYFKIKPHLYPHQRCQLGSKEIYEKLTNQFGSFYSHEWNMPSLNKELTKIWLRSYFDCEGWVFCKSHQNRHIGADCVNEKGLSQVKSSLELFGINSILKKLRYRKLYRLVIYGRDNLIKFEKEIGFLHPEKMIKLSHTLNDFMDYLWIINDNFEEVRKLGLDKLTIKKPYIARMISKEEINLIKLADLLKKLFDIEDIRINKRFNGQGNQYFELSINKKEEVRKLVKHNLINPLQLNRIDWRLFNNVKK